MDNTVLDTATGLVFVYLLLSLICSGVQEFISGFWKWRGKNLRKGLLMLLEGGGGRHSEGVRKQGHAVESSGIKSLPDLFFEHPVIDRLSDRHFPSYMPADLFSAVLVDVIEQHTGKGFSRQAPVLGVIESIQDEHLKRALRTLARRADGEFEAFMSELEHWFDHMTDRISGWYKRRTQLTMFALAFFIAVGLNVDTIRIADQLWHDRTTRQAVVAMADQYVREHPLSSKAGTAVEGGRQESSGFRPQNARHDGPGPQIKDRIEDLERQLAALSLPVGWSGICARIQRSPSTAVFWVSTFIGWFITACFVSLGAPFWFNTLSKALNLRAAGGRPPRARRPSARD